MKTIQVDDELFAYLEQHVQGFDDTPAKVIRRLIDLPERKPSAQPRRVPRSVGGKRPRARLRDLVEVGSLQEGQKLYLHDYHGSRVNGASAVICGDKLKFDGRLFSMSALARDLLNAKGYSGGAFRGPSFWHTSTGQSVTDLWDEYLAVGIETTAEQ